MHLGGVSDVASDAPHTCIRVAHQMEASDASPRHPTSARPNCNINTATYQSPRPFTTASSASSLLPPNRPADQNKTGSPRRTTIDPGRLQSSPPLARFCCLLYTLTALAKPTISRHKRGLPEFERCRAIWRRYNGRPNIFRESSDTRGIYARPHRGAGGEKIGD